MQLGKEINGGGEGTIYEVIGNPDIVAKIYHNPSKHINIKKAIPFYKKTPSEFITPDTLIEKNGVVTGYTMKYVNSDYFPISGLKYSKFCKKNNITDDDIKKILNKVIESVEKLHKIDIIIGDLNPENILTNGKEIRFIDCDSYKTPVTQHNNVLQPEITDWHNNASINKKADYFALSIIIFEILTHAHPYKGRHPDYVGKDRLKNRMIKNISLLGNYSKLVRPKSYTPLLNTKGNLFFEVFENGLRVVPNINGIVRTKVTIKPLDTSKINLKQVFDGDVNYFNFNGDNFVVNNLLYNIAGKGWFTVKNQSDTKKYYSNKNILHLNNKKNLLNNNQIIVEYISDKAVQIGNYIVDFSFNKLHIYDVDNISLKYIDTQNLDIFSKSLTVNEGIRFNTSKKTFVYGLHKNRFTSFEYNYKILGNKNFSTFSCFKYKENNVIKYGYFNLKDNTNVIKETNDLKQCCYNGDYIFEPDDNKINVLRPLDFEKIGEIECNVVNMHSELYYHKYGMLIVNSDSVFLMNTK